MKQKKKKITILFVCLGNICRSPSAEGIMKQLVLEAGLQEQIIIDSAGILDCHQGKLSDARMRAHAARRGYQLDSKSRPVVSKDFFEFDYIIGMDDRNIEDLQSKAIDIESLAKIHRMAEYFGETPLFDHVPDPYYGGADGFETVLDLLEDGCKRLLTHVSSNLDK